MAAPERASVGEVDERGHPYQDWLAVAAPSGDLELIAGGDGAHRNDAYRSDLARHGRCSAFFDGLLYNRAEIARRLGLPAATDSELVLHTYLRWGEDALRELEGSFPGTPPVEPEAPGQDLGVETELAALRKKLQS